MIQSTSIFLKPFLDIIPRSLGFMDRDPVSHTYGCCDRYFWHYFFHDYPNARFQEIGLLLALAYKIKHKDNPFYGKVKIKEWAKACWASWLANRNKDGSVTEAYPLERSFCATAFSTAAFLESVTVLDVGTEWCSMIGQVEKTVLWLSVQRSLDVANQMAASLLALAIYNYLTDGLKQEMLEKRLDACLSMMTEDGTFLEYGGFDSGYQSITLSLLLRVDQLMGGNQMLAKAIKKGLSRLEQSVENVSEINSGQNSRSTQYIYPYAIVSLKSSLTDSILDGLESKTLLQPSWLDDRYCMQLAIDYALCTQALLNGKRLS